MPDFSPITAYGLLERPSRRQWFGKTADEIRAASQHQQIFWLEFSAPNATQLPSVYRLPSRNYPLLVTGATVNRAASSLRLYSTDEQLTTYSVGVSAIAGDSSNQRSIFRWQEPILLRPNTAWRAELTLLDSAALALTTMITLRCIKLGERK